MRHRPGAVTAAELLYRNRRYRRVRGLQYGMWIAAILFALAALALPSIWPEGDALALAFLSPILASIALGMEFYRNLYVTEISALPSGLMVETLAFRGRQREILPWASLQAAISDERQYYARRAVSTAVMLRRPGRRLPFIIDTTDDALDSASLARLVRRRARRTG